MKFYGKAVEILKVVNTALNGDVKKIYNYYYNISYTLRLPVQ